MIIKYCPSLLRPVIHEICLHYCIHVLFYVVVWVNTFKTRLCVLFSLQYFFSFSYLFVCQEQLLHTTNIHYSTNILELEHSNHQIREFFTIHLFTLYCKIDLNSQTNVNFNVHLMSKLRIINFY